MQKWQQNPKKHKFFRALEEKVKRRKVLSTNVFNILKNTFKSKNISEKIKTKNFRIFMVYMYAILNFDRDISIFKKQFSQNFEIFKDRIT